MYSNVITRPSGEFRCAEGQAIGRGARAEELAAMPRWDAARVERIRGRCRGSVLARWADSCRRRWGEAGVARLREALGEIGAELPAEPPENSWFPVWLQVRMTDVVIDEFLDGDAMALQELLHEDIQRNLGRVKKTLLRSLGPGPILRRAKDLHDHLYSEGHAEARVRSGSAVIISSDTELVTNPTWQMLQMFAHRGLVMFTGREVVDVRATMPNSWSFEVRIDWI